MKKNIKINMKKRSRVAMGLLNLLRDDINQVRIDTDDFDLISLEESIREAKNTLRMLGDNITEIEYMLYLANSKESVQGSFSFARKLHTPLWKY